MFRKIALSLIGSILVCSHSAGAQAPQERINQPIIINGQQVQGVLIVQDSMIQNQTCPAPQQYVTADQSSSGWACFEPSTGMWLLHAQPPVQTAAPGPTIIYSQPAPPTVIYTQPAPLYVPAPAYAYGYYPFGYPYYSYRHVIGPGFGFGFGFGPIIINRPFIGRPFVGRPIIIGRPVAPFVGRPFAGGFRGGRFGRR